VFSVLIWLRNGAPERTGLNDPGESAHADVALEFCFAKLGA